MNVVCCVLDNRGIGLSSTPRTKTAYTTERMAQDVIETAVKHRRCVAHWYLTSISGFLKGCRWLGAFSLYGLFDGWDDCVQSGGASATSTEIPCRTQSAASLSMLMILIEESVT